MDIILFFPYLRLNDLFSSTENQSESRSSLKVRKMGKKTWLNIFKGDPLYKLEDNITTVHSRVYKDNQFNQ